MRADETLIAAVADAFHVAFLVTGALGLLAALVVAPWPAPRRAAPALAAAVVVAVCLPAAYAVLHHRLAPPEVRILDPCDAKRKLPGTGGLGGFLQDQALRLLDTTACRYHASREELVLALTDDADAKRFERSTASTRARSAGSCARSSAGERPGPPESGTVGPTEGRRPKERVSWTSTGRATRCCWRRATRRRSSLLRRHVDELLGFFARRTRDAELAADLTRRDVRRRADGRRRYRPEKGAGGAWLYGIALKKLADAQRRGYVEQRAAAGSAWSGSSSPTTTSRGSSARRGPTRRASSRGWRPSSATRSSRTSSTSAATGTSRASSARRRPSCASASAAGWRSPPGERMGGRG